jgi:two-component system sensor histidine kinase CiaH
MRRPASVLRRHALPTALLSTAVAALGLAALLTATDLIVSHNLTASVDQRLSSWVGEVQSVDQRQPREAAPDRDFDEPLLTWVAAAPGSCQALGTAPALPAGLCASGGPASADIGGVSFRLLGARLPSGGLVVAGESLAPQGRLLGDVVLAELIVGPLLLLLIFAGALAIGGRVGGSVERMRRRQLAFTADASHELRTPLSVIQAETDLARSADPRQLRPAITRIDGEVGRMRGIVEDLLWLARFDSEPQPPAPAVIDLATAAQLAVERFTGVARGRAIDLRVAAPEALLPISLPGEWLDRLLGVLIDNACRHAATRVVVAVRPLPGRRVELAVSDDGEGIPAGEMPLIFERFHRATAQGEGAGLGLAIADAIVRGTSGRWNVDPAPEGGARFAVSWPLNRTAAGSAAS